MYYTQTCLIFNYKGSRELDEQNKIMGREFYLIESYKIKCHKMHAL